MEDCEHSRDCDKHSAWVGICWGSAATLCLYGSFGLRVFGFGPSRWFQQSKAKSMKNSYAAKRHFLTKNNP